jgi:hypothetical protein
VGQISSTVRFVTFRKILWDQRVEERRKRWERRITWRWVLWKCEDDCFLGYFAMLADFFVGVKTVWVKTTDYHFTVFCTPEAGNLDGGGHAPPKGMCCSRARYSKYNSWVMMMYRRAEADFRGIGPRHNTVWVTRSVCLIPGEEVSIRNGYEDV